jgi:hypothetical protein
LKFELPEALDLVSIQGGIHAYDRHALGACLCNEETTERIAMVKR